MLRGQVHQKREKKKHRNSMQIYSQNFIFMKSPKLYSNNTHEIPQCIQRIRKFTKNFKNVNKRFTKHQRHLCGNACLNAFFGKINDCFDFVSIFSFPFSPTIKLQRRIFYDWLSKYWFSVDEQNQIYVELKLFLFLL